MNPVWSAERETVAGGERFELSTPNFGGWCSLLAHFSVQSLCKFVWCYGSPKLSDSAHRFEGAAAPKEKVASHNKIQIPNQKSNPKQALPKTADQQTYPTICCKKQPQKARGVSEKASPPYYLQPTPLSKKQSKKQPEKAPSEIRNFPPRKNRNLKISGKKQTQKQPKPNKTETLRGIFLRKVRRVLFQHVAILGY